MNLSGIALNKKIGNFTPVVLQTCVERWLPEGLIRGGVIRDFDTLSMIVDECVQDWGIKARKVRFTVPDSFVVILQPTI